jgi:hypothetical protein
MKPTNMRLWVGTRKGLFPVERRSTGWIIGEPHFLGVPILTASRDPRDGSVWACAGHRHWGAKIYRSRDGGRTFDESPCPSFPDGAVIDTLSRFGRRSETATIRNLLTLVPVGEPGRYLIGCDPGGLFESTDGGDTWSVNEPLWSLRNKHNWFEGGGGVMLHTILAQPAAPNHIRIAASCAGVYESTDGGLSWKPRNNGVLVDFLPEKYPEFGQDTHMLAQGSFDSSVLWQQNHSGNFRSTDGGESWKDVSDGLPSRSGFCLAMDDSDDRTAWTVPMESDACRTAPGGALFVCRTEDGGESWTEQRSGLPQSSCYDIVFRHALVAQRGTVVFGTTCGSIWASEDRGDSWRSVAAHLPPILSISAE